VGRQAGAGVGLALEALEPVLDLEAVRVAQTVDEVQLELGAIVEPGVVEQDRRPRLAQDSRSWPPM
jgi:hypothetical protein